MVEGHSKFQTLSEARIHSRLAKGPESMQSMYKICAINPVRGSPLDLMRPCPEPTRMARDAASEVLDKTQHC